jgi:hypothetical protein
MTTTDETTVASLAQHDDGGRPSTIDSVEGTFFDMSKTTRRSDQVNGLWANIEKLGLQQNITEFEVKGYTVISPEKLAPAGFTSRIRDAILDVAERRTGTRPDLDGADKQGLVLQH